MCQFLLCGLLSLVGLSGGSTPKTTHKFAVVGVYMDDAHPSEFNTHVVGSWALNVDLPADSSTAVVQKAAQAKCMVDAPKGWRCAEMSQWDIDKNNRRVKPCVAIALGMYRGVHDDRRSHNYTLWSSSQGFATDEEGRKWGSSELKRLSSQNNNDPLLREISISTNCVAPSA